MGSMKVGLFLKYDFFLLAMVRKNDNSLHYYYKGKEMFCSIKVLRIQGIAVTKDIL